MATSLSGIERPLTDRCHRRVMSILSDLGPSTIPCAGQSGGCARASLDQVGGRMQEAWDLLLVLADGVSERYRPLVIGAIVLLTAAAAISMLLRPVLRIARDFAHTIRAAPGIEFAAAEVDQQGESSVRVQLRVINNLPRTITLNRAFFRVKRLTLEVPRTVQICALSSSAIYEMDISRLQKKGDRAALSIAHVLKAGEADLFEVRLGAAEIAQSIRFTWIFDVWIETNAGDTPRRTVEFTLSRGERFGDWADTFSFVPKRMYLAD